MATIQIKPDTKVAVEDVLHGVAALDTPDLENFFQRVAQVLAERKSPHLGKRESELLIQINAGYPVELTLRYEQLLLLKQQAGLSPSEQEELIAITGQFEALDAQRLECLMELANLRDVSLEHLLDEMKRPSGGKNA